MEPLKLETIMCGDTHGGFREEERAKSRTSHERRLILYYLFEKENNFSSFFFNDFIATVDCKLLIYFKFCCLFARTPLEKRLLTSIGLSC